MYTTYKYAYVYIQEWKKREQKAKVPFLKGIIKAQHIAEIKNTEF